MKTNDLQGNLLSFYAAVALGMDKEADGRFWAPWDYWEGEIHYRGNSFLPFGGEPHQEMLALSQLYPHVKRLRLSTTPAENDRWEVTLPGQTVFNVKDPMQGYALAIVWSVYGAEVPDDYDCPNAKELVDLRPYNIPFGEPIAPPPPNAKTWETCTFEPGPDTTYQEALTEARRMQDAEESAGYLCDGHSWVLAQFHDGTSKYLYNGESTIGLPTLK
jgi:hypothetical protein